MDVFEGLNVGDNPLVEEELKDEDYSLALGVLNAGIVFNKIYTPILVLAGSLGNCLSLLVFNCRGSCHRRLSSSIYLSALALSDTGFLLSLLAIWLDDLGLGLLTSNSFSCPLIMYLGQITCFLSVYFTVAFTADRYFAIVNPFLFQSGCPLSRAKKIILALTSIASVAFSYVWLIATSMEIELPASEGTNGTSSCDGGNCTTKIRICSVSEEHLTISWAASYLDSIFTLILPFFLISYLNLRISIAVFELNRERKELLASASNSPYNGNHSPHIPLPQIVNNSSHDGIESHQKYNKRQSEPHLTVVPDPRSPSIRPPRHLPIPSKSTWNSTEVRITKMLLLVSTVFLVLNLPSHATRAIIFLDSLRSRQNSPTPDLIAAQIWSNLFFNTTFAVNFFLYCLSGKNFRASLFNIFGNSGQGLSFGKKSKSACLIRFQSSSSLPQSTVVRAGTSGGRPEVRSSRHFSLTATTELNIDETVL